MTTDRPRRIFGRTSLALAGAAVLAPVVGFLTIRHDWAMHDMSLELMIEGFVVTMFAVVAAGFFALCAVIAGGIGLARKADAVIVGSGRGTRDVVRDPNLMGKLALDPSCQIIGAQCSGALVLVKLGLLADVPACTDSVTKPWVEEAGVRVLEQPFVAHGNVATAGGCLASHYLAAW